MGAWVVKHGAVYICGGEIGTGREREVECADPVHDWPLPPGYVDASCEADSRLSRGWKCQRCTRCGLYGWWPGRLRSQDVRRPYVEESSNPRETDG